MATTTIIKKSQVRSFIGNGFDDWSDDDYSTAGYLQEKDCLLEKPADIDIFNQYTSSSTWWEPRVFTMTPIVEKIEQGMFEQRYFPPPTSTDAFFELSVTTTYVQLGDTGHHIADVANALLAWKWMGTLATKFEKVRPMKYTITLTVVMMNVMAKLKVRMYLKCDRIYAVELQNCRSDTNTVHNVYVKMDAFLRNGFKVVNEDGNNAEPPLIIKPYDNCFGCEDLDDLNYPDDDQCEYLATSVQTALLPIFQMANRVSQPTLQAEAAEILFKLTEPNDEFDQEATEILCTDITFEALRSLLSSSYPEVDFFTGKLLRNLEKVTKAKEYFEKYPDVTLTRLA